MPRKKKDGALPSSGYKVKTVFDYRRRVAIRAVAVPLWSSRQLRFDNQYAKSVREIIDTWHPRVLALMAEGVLTASQGKKLLACTTTTATSISPVASVRACGNRLLCPWCWGRRAAAVWSHLDRLVFPRQEGEKPPAKPVYELGEYRQVYKLGLRCGKQTTPGVVCRVRLGQLEEASVPFGPRNLFMRDLSGLGVLEFLSINPDAAAPGFTVTINRLYLLQPDDDLRVDVGVAGVSRRESPTRASLMRAVSRTFAYPIQLWTAHPAFVQEYLAGCNGQRLLAQAGILRNHTEKVCGGAGPTLPES